MRWRLRLPTIIDGGRILCIQPTFRLAVHPGEILQEMLDEAEVSQSQLAHHLHTDVARINEICRGKRGISAKMAVLLAKAFAMSPAVWMNLQQNWELSQVDRTIGKRIRPLRRAYRANTTQGEESCEARLR